MGIKKNDDSMGEGTGRGEWDNEKYKFYNFFQIILTRNAERRSGQSLLKVNAKA